MRLSLAGARPRRTTSTRCSPGDDSSWNGSFPASRRSSSAGARSGSTSPAMSPGSPATDGPAASRRASSRSSCSRELLEWAVRQRVSGLSGVEVRSGWTASGLALDALGRSVTGIRLREDRRHEIVLPATLVVDAAGRGSRTPAWLEALGFPRPEEEVIDPSVGYASRTYRRPAHPPEGWTVAYLQPAPPRGTRGGMLFPIEGGRWRVSLVGYCGDHPPTDDAGFLAFSRTLRSPLIHEAIRNAEPVSPIVGGRSSANRLRRYDSLGRRPEGLLVLGDAACAFNPVFAQGMTMAAIAATVLGRCLGERDDLRIGGRSLAERFQRRLATAQGGVWRLNRLVDGPLAGVDGRDGPAERVLRRYLSELGRLGCTRPSARRAALELTSLLRSPLGTLRADLLLAMLAERAGARPRGPPEPDAGMTAAGCCGTVCARPDTTEVRSADGVFPSPATVEGRSTRASSSSGVLRSRLLPPRLPPGCLARADLVQRVLDGLWDRSWRCSPGPGMARAPSSRRPSRSERIWVCARATRGSPAPRSFLPTSPPALPIAFRASAPVFRSRAAPRSR